MSLGTIKVRALDGEDHTLSGEFGLPVMEILRASGLVDAVCGGMCSCGTCLVRIVPAWRERSGECNESEEDLISCLDQEPSEGLRLSCQLEFGKPLDGLEMEIVEDNG